MGAEGYAKLAGLAAYFLMLLWLGFRPRMGFASWHMFAHVNRCRMKLEARKKGGSWAPLNPWDYLPHSHLAMSPRELDFFLAYLGECKRLEVRGTVKVRDGLRTYEAKVRKNRVVA